VGREKPQQPEWLGRREFRGWCVPQRGAAGVTATHVTRLDGTGHSYLQVEAHISAALRGGFRLSVWLGVRCPLYREGFPRLLAEAAGPLEELVALTRAEEARVRAALLLGARPEGLGEAPR